MNKTYNCNLLFSLTSPLLLGMQPSIMLQIILSIPAQVTYVVGDFNEMPVSCYYHDIILIKNSTQSRISSTK